MKRLMAASALSLSLVVAAPAAAVDRYVPMKGAPGAGPARYDRVFVQQLGPKKHDRVLVLVPGTNGGAGGITPVARDILRRVPRTQVWIVDRREEAFEDTSVFETRDPKAAQDYYLGFKYKAVRGTDAKFVSEWGLRLQLEDLRRVVKRAARGGREVILGGHSAGASTAVAYAAWDFKGRPGHRDLSGLVLIDGGLRGSFDEADAERARSELAEIRQGDVFLDLLGLGIPEVAGIFAQLGALYAYEQPDAPSGLQSFPLLPSVFKPSFAVTNEALFGYAFDAGTSPESLALVHIRAGGLAASGRPARLAGRRADSDPPPRPGLRGQRAQRHRVVLPAASAARHRRRQRAAPDRGDEGARTADRARPQDRPAALRLRHVAHRRPGSSWGAFAGPLLAHRAADGGGRPGLEPSRSALRSSAHQPLPRDGGALPEAPLQVGPIGRAPR